MFSGGAKGLERIFIAEDDEVILGELRKLLTTNGYQPVSQPPCELALLDVNLAEGNGFSLCRELKRTGDVPVIFLTARDGIEDELHGFSSGGDDYIRKPYNADVLLARIERLLRKKSGIISVRGLTLDENSFALCYGEERQTLTRTEMRIMYCLMKKTVCTKEEIIAELWNDSNYIDENALFVNINRLREKLKELGADGFLKTIRGVGYSL